MFFVLYVSENGVPGKMVGPFDYEGAQKFGLEFELPEEDLIDIDAWETDGLFQFSNGGGLYIVQSEDA